MPPEGRERRNSLTSPLLSPTSPAASLLCPGESCTDPLCSDLRGRSVDRDESVDSLVGVSVSGSMANLVQSSKEVRRMIREASFDSLTSDFSLDLSRSGALGASTELHLERLQGDVSGLSDTCGTMGRSISQMEYYAAVPSGMVTSRSEQGLSQHQHQHPSSVLPREGSLEPVRERERSTPDLRLNELPSAVRPTHFLRMTHLESPVHNNPAESSSSLEWESPLHGWHDLRHARYKLAVAGSRSASEYGGDDTASFVTNEDLDGLEWDCEGFSSAAESAAALQLQLQQLPEGAAGGMLGHTSWLPESLGRVELDLEAELEGSCLSSRASSANPSRSGSRRQSMDRFFHWNKRQPPSGRSSVERGSGDTPRQAIDHETLIKSFGVRVDNNAGIGGNPRLSMCGSTCSEESGFAEGGMDSSVTTIASTASAGGVATLSPVHEAREDQLPPSANATPCRKKASAASASTSVGRRKLFADEEGEAEKEEHLQVVIGDGA